MLSFTGQVCVGRLIGQRNGPLASHNAGIAVGSEPNVLAPRPNACAGRSRDSTPASTAGSGGQPAMTTLYVLVPHGVGAA